MKKIEAIIKPFKLDDVKEALTGIGVIGMASPMLQEIFGVNSHIRAVADGYAADGYLAIAPALFDRVEPGFETGYAQEDIERGRAVVPFREADDLLLERRRGQSMARGRVQEHAGAGRGRPARDWPRSPPPPR